MTPRNVALYRRVSTEDQTCANQLPDLAGYAERHGWKIVEQYVDEMTGSKESRPALDRLRADAKARKFSAVLCWKFDRISRNTRHLLTLHEDLSKSGVFLVSVTEGIDATTSAGKFTMTVMGAVAELERATLIERTKAGIRRARAEGKQIGARPRFPFDVNKIPELLAAGKSVKQIAQQLDAPRATIYRKIAALKRTSVDRPEPREVAATYEASDEDLPAVFWEAR